MEKKVFFTIPTSKLSKIEKNRPKWTSGKAYPKKYQKSQFFDHFGLPNPSQNPSKTFPNRAQEPLGRLLDPLGPSWQQSLKKRGSKVPQETPRRSQTLPKTLPKPLENPLKNACEKYMVLGSVFFKIFSNFGFQNYLFFYECLMHASIQISLIFGTLSPSQSISFGRMCDTF